MRGEMPSGGVSRAREDVFHAATDHATAWRGVVAAKADAVPYGYRAVSRTGHAPAIAFGPYRDQALALSLWFPFLACVDSPLTVTCVLILAAGVGCFTRALFMGLRRDGSRLIVRNFFQTVVLDIEDIERHGFPDQISALLHRLELRTKSGRRLRASGVSVWLGGLMLPWQRPDRRLHELAECLGSAELRHVYDPPKR